jgi:hypothetical protein
MTILDRRPPSRRPRRNNSLKDIGRLIGIARRLTTTAGIDWSNQRPDSPIFEFDRAQLTGWTEAEFTSWSACYRKKTALHQISNMQIRAAIELLIQRD